MESGPTNSMTDVPGTGVGHATVWRDEAEPPVGRGIARTGVTVIDPGGNLFREPIPAGGAILNGAGECTGFISAQEWGLLETPIFLTSTMQLGRVYDAACELLIDEDPGIGEDVIIPVVAECDDSFLNDARRMQVTREDVATALGAARISAAASANGSASEPGEGAVGSGTGMSCLGFKGGIGTASRIASGFTRRRSGHGELRRAGPVDHRRRTDRTAVAGTGVGRDAAARGRIVHRDRADRCPDHGRRLPTPRPPGRTRPRPDRLDRASRQR